MTVDALTEQSPAPAAQLRVLGFAASDLLQKELPSAFAGVGFAAHVTSPGYGIVIPALLRDGTHQPDALIVQMDVQGFYTRDWRQPSAENERLLEEMTDLLLTSIEEYAAVSRDGCSILINSLPSTISPSAGFLDAHHPDGAEFLTSYINGRLAACARQTDRITLVNTDLLMANIAPAKRYDAKLWFYGRMPYSPIATQALAKGFAEAYAARFAKPAKVLALDLDNTLWRGIYGEDGLAGLGCGDDFPGNAFKAFQEECLRLKSQGMLLTILSKNNADALLVFDEHPGMALKRSDFVGHRINWAPKSNNIRELAEDLDLDLDSFVFLDDSPHERDAMRQLAPEVCVPELPSDPAVRPDFLRNCNPTWPLRLTKEDRLRSKLYAVQAKGRELKRQTGSLEDYLGNLRQRLHIEAAQPSTLPRIAQMHARTNQFNLTTRRLSETELEAMANAPDDYSIVLGRLTDRFGDHGIVICGTVRLTATSAELLTFLMSCRVIGRDVERAFLDALLRHLTARGVESIEATYTPTAKNTPARDFCGNMGFGRQCNDILPEGAPTKWLWTKRDSSWPGAPFVTVDMGLW
jgi:FkbH-like protein